MSPISLVSVYPIKINLPISTKPEIVDIKPIDYLFEPIEPLQQDLSNISNILNSVKFIQSEDLDIDSNITLNPINISDNLLNYLSINNSLDELVKYILKDNIQTNYDIYLDNINSEVSTMTTSVLSGIDLSSYTDTNLLLVYKFNIEHKSTDFIKSFSDYLSLDYIQQQPFEFLFGILYKLGN
mgnify:CR=1 FL=1|tara:strand:+ start:254 stop:802 length:549 start_codon:yes stop_codon:yes gene_type:complete